MSLKAMIWAFEQKCKTPIEKLMLIALSNVADDDGRFAAPKTSWLASICCTSDRNISRATKSLFDTGLIKLYEGLYPRLVLPTARASDGRKILLATVDGERVSHVKN